LIRILIMRHVFRVRTSATTRYCVALDEGHNSPVEWAEEGLPGGQVQDEDSSKVEAKVQVEVRSEV
jgi:hypothetical protein